MIQMKESVSMCEDECVIIDSDFVCCQTHHHTATQSGILGNMEKGVAFVLLSHCLMLAYVHVTHEFGHQSKARHHVTNRVGTIML